MIRYVSAVILACVYIGGSVCIVQRAGDRYRAGLDQTRRLLAQSKRNSASPPVNEATSPSIEAANLLPPPSKPVSPDTAAQPSEKAATDLPKTVPPTVAVAKAQPAVMSRKKNADANPDAKAAPIDPLANDPFWNQPELKKPWDVTHLKPDDERQLRDILHAVIVHFNPLVADQSPWLNRLDDAAAPFLSKLQRKDIKYQFFILDSDSVNAFSIPGGNIYISRGLFNLIGNDEDYALEFAIGHEIAHVDLQHAIDCLRMKGMKELPRGTIFKLYLLILPFGYVANDKVNQEFAADLWVMNKMKQSQRTRRETLAFLQKLEGYSRDHGFYSGRMQPQPKRDLSPVENHYRAQISARERLKHLKEVLGPSAVAPK